MIGNCVQCVVSLNRIALFLQEEETEKYTTVTSSTEADSLVVGFENATFSYASPTDEVDVDSCPFELADLDVIFPEGELSLVVGKVGSVSRSTVMDGATLILVCATGQDDALAFAPRRNEPRVGTNLPAFAAVATGRLRPRHPHRHHSILPSTAVAALRHDPRQCPLRKRNVRRRLSSR